MLTRSVGWQRLSLGLIANLEPNLEVPACGNIRYDVVSIKETKKAHHPCMVSLSGECGEDPHDVCALT